MLLVFSVLVCDERLMGLPGSRLWCRFLVGVFPPAPTLVFIGCFCRDGDSFTVVPIYLACSWRFWFSPYWRAMSA